MAEIVDLKSAGRLIWLCGHCGCTTFRLYDDHRVVVTVTNATQMGFQ